MQVGDPAVDKHNTEFGSDWVHVKRLRTLQSVDVMVERLVKAVEAKGQLSSTYILLSSDNGYHLGAFYYIHCTPRSLCCVCLTSIARPTHSAAFSLGQFGLGYDKRQMYEEVREYPLSDPGIHLVGSDKPH
jgi:arylsulfatase A-like enzyme